MPPRVELPTARGLALSTSLANDAVPGMLVGGASLAARTVAPQALVNWRFAYWSRHLYPHSAAARRVAKHHGERLLLELRNAAKSAEPALAAALARDIDDLTRTVTALSNAAGGVAAVAPRLSELARLENAALTGAFPGPSGNALRAAFRRWREASTTYDLADLEDAGAALAKTIDETVLTRAVRKSGNYRAPSYYRERIASAVRTLRRSAPTEEATDAFVAIEKAIAKEGDSTLEAIWREQIRVAVSHAPHTWDKLANALAGIETIKATNTAAIEAAVDRIKGILGEMISLSVPAYRDALLDATRHADQLAAALNLRALRAAQKAGAAAAFKPPYRVLFPQFDLKAPGTSGKGLRLFFDDAVLLVNDAATPPEAFVLFASQVKAGDASTAGAVEQMIADQTRLLSGRISVGATEYVLRPPPDIGSVTRVFVGTKSPPGAELLSGRIQLVKGPLDGITLAQFAEFMLRAAGKIK